MYRGSTKQQSLSISQHSAEPTSKVWNEVAGVLSYLSERLRRTAIAENLNFSISDERFIHLAKLEANSDEALELLAEIAAMEGAPTRRWSCSDAQRSDYRSRVLERLR